MKILYLFIILSLFHNTGNGQVSSDPATGQMDILNPAGSSINANFIAPGEVLSITVPVNNLNQLVALPAGSCKLTIDLGLNMVLAPAFDLSKAPLSNYFNWSSATVNGRLVVTGNLTTPLPGDFYGNTELKIQATTILGSSDILANFLVTNHNTGELLTDEDPSNNTASLSYTVTLQTLPVIFSAVHFSTNNCMINIDFTAENEVNVSSYGIEYSTDGVTFINGGQIKATNSIHYHTVLPLPNELQVSKLFMRIKSLDIDGRHKYSLTKALNNLCKRDEHIRVFPNPMGPNVALLKITASGTRLGGFYSARLFDNTGRLLKSERLSWPVASAEVLYNTGDLTGGAYTLQLADIVSGKILSVKFIKQ